MGGTPGNTKRKRSSPLVFASFEKRAFQAKLSPTTLRYRLPGCLLELEEHKVRIRIILRKAQMLAGGQIAVLLWKGAEIRQTSSGS